MKEEIERTINKLVDMGWITINKNLEPAVLTEVFIGILKEMSLKKFIQSFDPF